MLGVLVWNDSDGDFASDEKSISVSQENSECLTSDLSVAEE